MTAATQIEHYFLSLINKTRKDAGLDTVQLETHLNQSADNHSAWMLQTDSFSHTGVGGSSPRDRIEAAGFQLDGSWRVAENVAYVSLDNDGDLRDEVRVLHQGLMDSSNHRQNILDKDFDLIGIGLQTGWLTIQGQSYQVVMVAQNFAYTGGGYTLDIKPGLSISTTADPSDEVAGPVRSQWVSLFDGELLRASPADRVILGTAVNDDLRGYALSDELRGQDGADWMSGGRGNDRLDGGNGDDFLLGGQGHDRMVGGSGHDKAAGGHGNDSLHGNGGRDSLRGDGGQDYLDGGAGNDRLSGGNGADRLIGGAGADMLAGNGGADILRGGSGKDTIIGGGGNDILYGGQDADRFVFHHLDGIDRILDYQPGEDRLLLERGLLGDDVAGFVSKHVQETSYGVLIDLGDDQQIQLRGRGLDADDVIGDIFLI